MAVVTDMSPMAIMMAVMPIMMAVMPIVMMPIVWIVPVPPSWFITLGKTEKYARAQWAFLNGYGQQPKPWP